MRVGPADVLQLGEPSLRIAARPVERVDQAFGHERDLLHAVLRAFREEHGFGRAIAAPQIGVPRRFIALDLGDGPFTVINPEITYESTDTFTLWDDCMSFPELLVRVSRHVEISLTHLDEEGCGREWSSLSPAHSELLQHEIDHLDGVLAVDRAVDRQAIVKRSVYERRRDHFDSLVDSI